MNNVTEVKNFATTIRMEALKMMATLGNGHAGVLYPLQMHLPCSTAAK